MPRGGGRRKQSQHSATYSELDDDTISAVAFGDNDDGDEDMDSEVVEEISPPVDEDGEEIFIVEKILDKKEVGGKTQYYLRWQGYTADYDTWEPQENLECEELVEEFEKEWREKQKRGFDRGLRAERIIGVFYDSKAPPKEENGVKFIPKPNFAIVKWIGVEDADCVPVEACAEKIPQLLIKYYEDRRIGLMTREEAKIDNLMDNEYLRTKGFEIEDDEGTSSASAMPTLVPFSV